MAVVPARVAPGDAANVWVIWWNGYSSIASSTVPLPSPGTATPQADPSMTAFVDRWMKA